MWSREMLIVTAVAFLGIMNVNRPPPPITANVYVH